MKPASALLLLGVLTCTLGAFGQTPAPKPDQGVPSTAPSPSSADSLTPPTPGLPAQISPGAPIVAADVDPDYILGETDTIVVNVWKEPSLTGGLVIRPDGKISLPLIGDLTAAGLTPMALASQISERLKKFMNDPTVTVTVTAANSRRIFFIGEVGHPGPMQLTRSMTMLQAIAAAGGLTPYAKKKFYILRGEKGKETKIFFDYNKALKKGDMQGVVPISGDTVVVP